MRVQRKPKSVIASQGSLYQMEILDRYKEILRQLSAILAVKPVNVKKAQQLNHEGCILLGRLQ